MTSKRVSNSNEVVDCFVRETMVASYMAKALDSHFGDHMGVSVDDVDWGHVGSAKRAVEVLGELMDFLGLESGESIRSRLFK